MALASEGHQVQTANDIIRDPFVLEFTGLPKQKRYKEKDRDPFVLEFTGLPKQKRYKEKDLEDALKANMEKFLLELGRGFAFIGRQYIVPIGARRFKVDLVFYHAILKCYVLIELLCCAQHKRSYVAQPIMLASNLNSLCA